MTDDAKEASSVRVIRWKGGQSWEWTSTLKELVLQSLREGDTNIVVDLSGVGDGDTVDALIGRLIRALKAAREGGGDLRVACAPPELERFIEWVQLGEVLPNYATEEDACRSFEET
jgi:anti-sigma B factor antagonist